MWLNQSLLTRKEAGAVREWCEKAGSETEHQMSDIWVSKNGRCNEGAMELKPRLDNAKTATFKSHVCLQIWRECRMSSSPSEFSNK